LFQIDEQKHALDWLTSNLPDISLFQIDEQKLASGFPNPNQIKSWMTYKSTLAQMGFFTFSYPF